MNSDAVSVRSMAPSTAASSRIRAQPSLVLASPYSIGAPNRPVRKHVVPELKTIHTYTGATGKLIVQLMTPPQALPTYMGGSKARGRGSVVGRVRLVCNGKDRVSEVRIKLKAVVSALVPKHAQATEGNMPTFTGLLPSETSTSSKEQVLLSLDERLKLSEAKFQPSDSASVHPNTSHKLEEPGTYEWEFQFDIPEHGSGNNSLPLGFPGVGINYPSSYVLESDVRKRGASADEWASVKWYVKVTVGRPGLFRSNDRLLVPFIYLPPPPEKISSLIIRRQALSMQIQRLLMNVRGPVTLPKDLAEPVSSWLHEYFPLNQASLGQNTKRSFVDKLLGANKPKEERWAISLPGKPLPVFPLRSIIPFVLTLVHSDDMPLVVHPEVYLVQKVHLRARISAAHTQYISHAKILASPATKSGMQQWFGWVQFPSWCSPTFDVSILGLEYFLQVKPLNTPQASVLCTIPVGLYCAPPRLAQAKEVARSRSLMRPTPKPSYASSTTSSATSASIRTQPAGRQQWDSASIRSNDTTARVPPASSLGSPSNLVPPSRAPSRQPSFASSSVYSQDPRWASEASGASGASLDASSSVPRPGLVQTSHNQAPATPPQLQRISNPATSNSTPSTYPVDSASPEVHAATATSSPAVPPPLPQREQHRGNSAAAMASLPPSHGSTTPQPINVLDREGEIHDAGPLTVEQEQAWTMDILSNAFEDEAQDTFELPPSYFEAVGIADHDE
ncbi:hypothetical protein MYAM1_002583 [Malassezia yamatoensis]|uniref:Arrestin-like N-terminal domain-containing protein n=1 Tax=Malassezia yamatoensis TaxID=253288 RepID=A0AAJ6CGZ1_9BASI|nr:hypothetical protein MYAM1_002583 [Malassezia yamatoensis]